MSIGHHSLQTHFDAMRGLSPEKAVPFLESLRDLLGDTFDINWSGLLAAWNARRAR